MRILAYDIETSPLITYTWGLFNQNIGITQIEEPTRVMCFAARWVDEPKNKIMFFSEHHDTREEMVSQAWDLIDEADAVLHYNGKSFDTKHMNREFLMAGLSPPSPVKEIDLLQAVRKVFKFPSNKLQYVSQTLGIGEKAKHEGFDLWLKCMAGDPAAWERMKRYNLQDVHLLIDMYQRLLPWLTGLPNAQLYGANEDICPKPFCGGKVHKRGFRPTSLGFYQRYQCTKCGGWSTSGKSLHRVDIRGE